MNSQYLSHKYTFFPALICLSSGLFFMYEFFQLGVLNNLNDILRSEYQITGVKVSRLSNAYSLGNMIFLLPAGILLDRYSTKKIILFTMGVCVIGTLGMAISSSIFLTIFSRFLTGIGNAFCLAAGILLISRWLPGNRQAFFIGLLVTMAYIGGILSGPSFLYFINNYGWREALLIDAAWGVLILIWMMFIIKDSPDPNFHTREMNNQVTLSTGLKEALSNHQNWLGGIYISLINLPIMIFGALWGISYLEDVHKIADELGSDIIVCFYLGAIIGCPFFGWLSDKISRRKPIMYFGCVAMILVFIPIFIGLSLGFFELCVLFFCIGFVCSTQVIGYPLISESNKSDCIAKATSIATFLVMLLGAAGCTLFAGVLDFFTPSYSLSYSAGAYKSASIIFLISFFIALLITFFVKETYCKKSEK